jgi:hypothetical protein
MARVAESTASLRIMGDDLDPAEITGLLGCAPTQGERRGDRIVSPKSGHVRISKCGMWRLEAQRALPEDFDAQVHELLTKLSGDLSVWAAIRAKYTVEVFSGLFMDGSMEGIVISAETVKSLGDRGVEIGFDIYGADLKPTAGAA